MAFNISSSGELIIMNGSEPTTSNNATATVSQEFLWNTYTAGGLAVFILSLVFNSLTLSVVLHKRELLQNPFYIYIVNLLVANLLVFIVNGPVGLVAGGYQVWSFGTAFCDMFLYCQYVLGSVSLLCHLLITTNRIWAVMHPITYKRLHTRKAAVIICLTMWIAIHIIMLPGVILNRSNALPLEEYGCLINVITSDSLKAWNAATEVLLTLVDFLIVLAYPLILVRHRQRQKVRPGTLSYKASNTASNIGTGPALWQRFRTSRSVNASRIVEDLSSSRRDQRELRVNHRKSQSSNAFWVLTLSTGSVFLLLTPCLLYNCIISFADYYDPQIFGILTLLYSSQAVLDPILFTLALSDLRSFKKKLSP